MREKDSWYWSVQFLVLLLAPGMGLFIGSEEPIFLSFDGGY